MPLLNTFDGVPACSALIAGNTVVVGCGRSRYQWEGRIPCLRSIYVGVDISAHWRPTTSKVKEERFTLVLLLHPLVMTRSRCFTGDRPADGGEALYHPQLTAVGKIVAGRQSPTGETIDGRQNDPVNCDSSTFLNITIYPADQYHPPCRRKQYGRLD